MAFEDPPEPHSVTTAFSRDRRVRMSRGFTSSQIISTMLRPQAAAIRWWAASIAGIEEAPASVSPSASAVSAMEDALPMIMAVPGVRAGLSGAPSDANCASPCSPPNIGPAGSRIIGRLVLMPPISIPAVVLPHPPSSTAPSTGCWRSSSSTSMARKLRYSMVVGLIALSARDMVGSSTGKPPACQTPRFTSSTRSRKCAWAALMPLHGLRMATIGLPRKSPCAYPICASRARCLEAPKRPVPYQRWLRSASAGLR